MPRRTRGSRILSVAERRREVLYTFEVTGRACCYGYSVELPDRIRKGELERDFCGIRPRLPVTDQSMDLELEIRPIEPEFRSVEKGKFTLHGERESDKRQQESLYRGGMLRKWGSRLGGWAWIPSSGSQMVFNLLAYGPALLPPSPRSEAAPRYSRPAVRLSVR